MELQTKDGRVVEVSDEAFTSFVDLQEIPESLDPERREEVIAKSAADIMRRSGHTLSSSAAEQAARETISYTERVYVRILELRFLEGLR